MDRDTVFTKTAKGITQVNQRSASLSKDLMKVLKLIDGKSNFGVLLEKSEMDKMVLEKALNTLIKDGFSRIFETKKKEDVDALGDDAAAGGGSGDDFDFTAPGKMPAATQRVVPGAANDIAELARHHEKQEAQKKALEKAHADARDKARAQAEARAKAEAEAKARGEAEAQAMEQAKRAKEAAERAKAEMEAKAKEEEARRQALAATQAKAAAEAKAKEEAEAKRFAEMRAKAEAEARVLAEARVKAEAEAKAQAEARAKAEAEARRQMQDAADAAARAKAEAEAQALAKARIEAEAKAAAESRAAKEAADKARAELEARMREEEVRRKVAAEVAAKLAAEQKATAEAEAKRIAEARARAEIETKALAEARAKAEAEAQLLAKARAEAEESAKRLAEDAKNSEREMKARLKEEIEARIRGEMETLLRTEMEEKAGGGVDADVRAQIMEEAKLAARAELEERLKEEREELHKAEAAARSAAEQAARERADLEGKLREEAEARARMEAEGRIRAEAESARLRRSEMEARVAAEAAAKEREEAAKRFDAERRSKIEMEAKAKVDAEERARQAKVDAEERAKRDREMAGKMEAEKRAREQAEKRAEDTRAQVEAEMVSDMGKRAELEGKAQAKAFMDAKVVAEQEEDNRLRAEQDKRARELADVLRTKVTPDSEAPESTPTAKRQARKKRGSLVKTMLGLVIAVVAIGLIVIHVIPMRGIATKAEKSLSGWLHDDVSIASAKYWLFPTPHLRVEGVSVGKAFDAKAAGGKIYVDVGALWGDKASISSVELAGVTLNNEAVRRILDWGKIEGKKEAADIRSIRLTSVKIDVKPDVEPFNAYLEFKRDGSLQTAVLQGGGKWSLNMKPVEGGMDIDFSANNWELPLGAPIPISTVRLKGKLTGNEIVIPEFEADTMEGKANGTLRVSWGTSVKMESDISVAKAKVTELMRSLTKDISITGKLDGNFSVSAESATLETLLKAPRSQGKFKIVEGSISNMDLVAVMQSDAAGQRAGVTKFLELSGEFMAGENRAAFRNVTLQGGVLRGSGAIDIGANSTLSGRLALEIRSQVAQDRGTFTISGTVAKPSIRRGG